MIYRMENGAAKQTSGEPAGKLAAMRDQIGDSVAKSTGRIGQFISERPEICLGVALGLGLVTGWIIKRRT